MAKMIIGSKSSKVQWEFNSAIVDQLHDNLIETIDPAFKSMVKVAKAATPVKTGALKKSIRKTVAKLKSGKGVIGFLEAGSKVDKRGKITAVDKRGGDPYYASFVELGVPKRSIKGKGFMRAGYASRLQYLKTAATKAVNKLKSVK